MEWGIIQLTETGEEFFFDQAGSFRQRTHAEMWLEDNESKIKEQYPESQFYVDIA